MAKKLCIECNAPLSIHGECPKGHDQRPSFVRPTKRRKEADTERTSLEDLQALPNCPSCKGTTTVTCTFCEGRLTLKRREGRSIVDVSCTACKNGRMECPDCKGTGKEGGAELLGLL